VCNVLYTPSHPLSSPSVGLTLAALSTQAEETRRITSLFDGLVFFLSREVPREPLEFALKSFGADVRSFDLPVGCTEADGDITHQVVDRPPRKGEDDAYSVASREYVQPQWVFDSINAGMRLPCARYAPGATLPVGGVGWSGVGGWVGGGWCYDACWCCSPICHRLSMMLERVTSPPTARSSTSSEVLHLWRLSAVLLTQVTGRRRE
jgi:hypothetical protein